MKTRIALLSLGLLFIAACEKSDSGLSGPGAGIFGSWRMPDNATGEAVMKIDRNQVTGTVSCVQADGQAVQATVTVSAEVTDKTFRILESADKEVPAVGTGVCYVRISAMEAPLEWEVKDSKLILKAAKGGPTFEYLRVQ